MEKSNVESKNIVDFALKQKWYSEKKNDKFEKKLDSPEVRKSLSLQVPRGDTTSIPEFLDAKNPQELLFYDELWSNICPCSHMNPHVENLYSEYFVDNIDGKDLLHVKKFKDLLETDDNGKVKIKLYRDKTIFHIGAKGSGKTLWQNVWLYDNNKYLEDNDILWVRLDVEKLYKLWKKDKEYTFCTQDYIYGQLLYIICKHYQDRKNTKSDLIAKIVSEFSKTENNTVQTPFTKAETKIVATDDEELALFCKLRKISKITDLLSYFEKEIAINEKLNIGENRKTVADTNREYSYYIDEILKKKDNRFNAWMTVAKKMYNFVLDNNYFILILIDGIDNIDFHTYQKELTEKIFHQLCHYHLSETNQNIITIISLRDYVYTFLKRYAIKNNYVQYRNGKYLDYTIYQQEINLGKKIFDKRVDYINKYINDSNCKIAQVFKVLKEDHKVDDTKWNANYRSFLANHISLAKYIAFKSYWRPKGVPFDNKYIKKEIKRYDDINFLLNGELFVSEKYCPPQTEDFGINCFNLFDYEFNMPDGADVIEDIFIFIRLLLIIQKKDMPLDSIIKINEEIFNINEENTKTCIDILIDYGLIHLTLSNNKRTTFFLCSISKKGSYAISKCLSDIHFLYFLSLDTYLPISLLEKIRISPNNIEETEQRKYPIACIISGLTFLNYLLFKYKNELKLIKNEDLKPFEFVKKDFDLPIDRAYLISSISKMLEIIINNGAEYSNEFYEWKKTLKIK